MVMVSGSFRVRRGRLAVRKAVLAFAGVLLVLPLGSCGSESTEAAGYWAKVRGEATRAAAPTPTLSDTPTEQPTPEPEEQPLEGPYTVRIPEIGVDAPVVSIEVNADRVLVPPRELSVVGWWSDGAAPGSARGSAVLVGHSARAGGGVFDDVGDLQAGDTIEVAGESDALTYEVESVEVLSKADLARNAEEIFDQSSAGRLVVITCEDFDGTTWRSNIVTIATPA